jgi:hypothetical protein
MRPALLEGYLDTLSWQLPGPVVEELADGLEETYRRHLRMGLGLEAAAARGPGGSPRRPASCRAWHW